MLDQSPQKWLLAISSAGPWTEAERADFMRSAAALPRQFDDVLGLELEWRCADHDRFTDTLAVQRRIAAPWEAFVSLWSRGAALIGKLNPPGSTEVSALRMREQLGHDFLRDWPDGQRTRGVKKTTLWKARADLPPTVWQARYGAHTRVVRDHHSSAWKYRQNVIEVKPAAFPYDAVSELWWPTLEGLTERFYNSEESKRFVANDVAGFLDTHSAIQVVTHHTIISTLPCAVPL